MKTLNEYVAVLGNWSEEQRSADGRLRFLYWDFVNKDCHFDLIVNEHNMVVINSPRWTNNAGKTVSLSDIFSHLSDSFKERIIYNLDLF